MTSRWPAVEYAADWSEKKQKWYVSGVTEIPGCGHLISAKRVHADKATARKQITEAIADKVRRHPNHKKGK